jgi:hypothetical protein
LLPNGGFTYIANAGFLGTDSFTYSARDGLAASTPVMVTIMVTATVTPSPPPVPCTPRPRVQTQAQPGRGALQVTITPTALNTSAPNTITSLRFGQFQNATVTLNGQAIASGQTVALSPAQSTVVLTVGRQSAGQPTTVPFTVVDTCGEWPTFVGGGPNAF